MVGDIMDMLEDICNHLYMSKIAPSHLRDYLRDNNIDTFEAKLKNTQPQPLNSRLGRTIFNVLTAYGKQETRLKLWQYAREYVPHYINVDKGTRRLQAVAKFFTEAK